MQTLLTARPAFLLDDVIHVSQREEKFDARRNTVRKLSCDDEVIQTLK